MTSRTEALPSEQPPTYRTLGRLALRFILSFCLIGLVQQSKSKMASRGKTAQSEARGGAGGGESPGTRGSPANQLGLQLHVFFDPTAYCDHGGHVQVSKPRPAARSGRRNTSRLPSVGHVSTLSVSGMYRVEWEGDLLTTNWKGFGKKRLFPRPGTIPTFVSRD